MITLTETRIDLADRHTTLYYLGDQSERVGPLRIGKRDRYQELYKEVAEGARVDYSTVAPGREATILHKLSPVYSGAKYWTKYLRRAPDVELVWEEALPLIATLKQKISVLSPESLQDKVSPVPRVLLYPFGWSTWISLRIKGEHTINDLESLITQLFTKKALKRFEDPSALSMRTFLKRVSDGVRTDAFGGKKTGDLEAAEIALVITVLEKHGGSLALGSLGTNEQNQLAHLVRPDGPSSLKSFDELIFHPTRKNDNYDLNYVVIDKLGRFMWIEKLLNPEERNYQLLNCYHHNSFMSLVQAWHWEGLLTQGAELKNQPIDLKELSQTAVKRLKNPGYKSASVRAFLQSDPVQSLVNP